MMAIVDVLLTLLSLAAFSLAFFLAIASLLKRHNDLELLLFSAGMGPVFMAMALGHMMKYIPGLHPLAYVAFIGVLAGLLACVGRREFGRLGVARSQLLVWIHAGVTAVRQREWITIVPLVIVGGGVFLMLLLTMVLPLTANDPLEYATIARLIVERADAGVYPIVQPDPVHGYYLPFAHPPTYPLLMAWTFLLQGGSTRDIAIRMLTTWHTISFLALMASALRNGPRERGLIASLFYVTTPAAVAVIITDHVDPMRLFCLFAAFLTAAWLLVEENWRYAVLFGIAIASSMATHSLGVLAAVLAIPIYCVLSRAPLRNRFIFAAIASIVSLVLAGWHYWLNFRLFGSPIKNALPMWNLPQLAYEQYLDYSRGTVSRMDRLAFGLLMGFTRLSSFGFSYWLCLFSVIAGRGMFTQRDQPLPRVLGLALLGFYVLMTVMFLFGARFASMNDRYQLTVQPLIACLSAWGFMNYLASRPSRTSSESAP